MSPRPSLHLALLAAPLAASLHAQSAPQTDPTVRRGPASRFASGISLDPASRTAPDYAYLRGPSGSIPTVPWTPTTPVQPGEPNYSLKALFPSHWSSIEVDAFSTGNALIPPVDAQGGLVLSGPSFPDRWFGLALSVTNASVGDRGSLLELLRTRLAGSRTLGADVISHYWAGSVGLASSVAGTTVLEQLRGELGFAKDEEVDGFDFALGVQRFTPRLASRVFFLETGKYYFSVSRAWASSSAAATFIASSPPDPAAIYRMDWNSQTGQWSAPFEYYSRAELGLIPASLPGGDTEDVDAIAVNEGGGVIFSTRYVTGRAQLMIYDARFLTSPLPLMASATMTADQAFGLAENDEVDGVCGWDPEPFSGYGNTVGYPTEDLWSPLLGSLGEPAGLSMTRWRQADGIGTVTKDSLVFELSGWGSSTPRSCYALAFITGALPSPIVRPPSSFLYYNLFFRQPTQATLEFTIDNVQSLVGHAALGLVLIDASTQSMMAVTPVTDFQL